MKIYRKGTELDVRTYNILMDRSGLGDLIARLPAVKYTLETHPQIKVNLFVHVYGVDLCKKLLPYENLTVASIDDANEIFDDTLPGRSPDRGHISNLAMHMTLHAFITIVGRQPEDKDMNYLVLDPINVDEFKLPSKYIVITTGYTSESRRWPTSSINEVVDYVITKGYTPVFLGRSFTPAYRDEGINGSFDADYTKGINLIDSTDLFQAHAIMSKSAMVIGLDNGLLHLGSLSEDTKIVYGFTTVEPYHRLPVRKNKMGHRCYTVVPSKDELRCIGCQSNFTFVPQTHDFRGCFYQDFKCLDLMTSDKWIEQIERALNDKTPQERADDAYEQILATQELNRKIKELLGDDEEKQRKRMIIQMRYERSGNLNDLDEEDDGNEI